LRASADFSIVVDESLCTSHSKDHAQLLVQQPIQVVEEHPAAALDPRFLVTRKVNVEAEHVAKVLMPLIVPPFLCAERASALLV
jgi:hypothetical protein